MPPILNKHHWRKTNPLWIAVISWVITFGSFVLGDMLIRQFGWHENTRHLVLGFVLLAACAPFAALLQAVMAYKRNAVSLIRIIRLYASLVLICANMNFIIMMHFSRYGAPPFHGIEVPWAETATGQPLAFIPEKALEAVVDCLYFSVETLSTVGYGDIYPTQWYAKLAVTIEILLGLSITVLTVGRHFARKSNTDTPR